MKKITIAIDGFSSCGKSTMAKDLAKEIGYIYIDSGAMYRAVTLYCLENSLFNSDGSVNSEELEKHINDISVSFCLNNETLKPETFLNGVNVESKIRTMDVSSRVSLVAALGFVREALVKLQQEMGKSKGIVMDGRDIGTVVFPDAELKIFVTASAEIRAKRRYDELMAKGQEVSFDEILKNVEERDRIDQTRAVSPLRKADDAIVLDNSNMTVEEQKAWLINEYQKAANV
ncbi:(d)CMP kinase [uncultured Bacteroides sp.]|uniref:(d)CMP kinase n=1 Tax=uncultured Bacteroides sp. TaxID=162156 RepID=UPI0025990F5D|nr:(d)CMP kinase [uncultured Bacteroides sp.]